MDYTGKKAEISKLIDYGFELLLACPPNHEGMDNYHCIHCKSPGKRPINTNWGELEGLTMADFEITYRENPKYNYLLKVGKGFSMNVLSIDIDGQEGEQWYRDNEYRLPNTLAYTSGNGLHVLYRLPFDLKCKQKVMKLDDGHNEVRFQCGDKPKLAVVPPSIHHNGNDYRWMPGCSLDETNLTQCPEWIIDYITSEVNEENGDYATSETPDLSKKITHGERNESMTQVVGSLVGSLYRKGMSQEIILKACLAHNEENVVPPLSEDTVKSMVQRMYTKESIKQEEPIRTEKVVKYKKENSKDDLTPTYLADKFIEYYDKKGIKFRYHSDRKKFYKADAFVPCWEQLEDIEMSKCISRVINTYETKLNVKRIRGEVSEVLAMKMLHRDEYDGRKCDVSCNAYMSYIEDKYETVASKNGVVNLDTRELLPWNPMKHDHSIVMNFEYNPTLNGIDLSYLNMWEKALESWLPDPDTRAYLQEYMGYALVSRNELRTMTFLYGSGSNGKSLFLEVIQYLFDKNYAIINPEAFSKSQFATAQLIDKTMYICPDMDSVYFEKTGIIKQISAGDMIRAEYKGGASFQIRPIGKLLISANELPQSKDTSHGYYSRLRIVPFMKTFKPDPKFKKRLETTFRTERGKNVLFHWALAGYERLKENNYEWTESMEMNKIKASYMIKNDPTTEFLVESLLYSPERKLTECVQIQALYETYKYWARDMGYKSVSRRQFSNKINDMKIESVPTTLVTAKGKKAIRVLRNKVINEDTLSDVCCAVYFESKLKGKGKRK